MGTLRPLYFREEEEEDKEEEDKEEDKEVEDKEEDKDNTRQHARLMTTGVVFGHVDERRPLLDDANAMGGGGASSSSPAASSSSSRVGRVVVGGLVKRDDDEAINEVNEGSHHHHHRNNNNTSSLLMRKMSKARETVNVPSALGGFAIGVKFGFVLLLCALVSLPREKLDSLRTNLGEFLPIGMSERIFAPESTYKREHGSVARLGAAKPLAGDWNPNQKKSEKREVKYPRKDLTPKPKKTVVAKKKGEEKKSSEKEEKDEKVKHSTFSSSSSSSSSLSLKKQRASKKDSEGEEKGKRQKSEDGDAKDHHENKNDCTSVQSRFRT